MLNVLRVVSAEAYERKMISSEEYTKYYISGTFRSCHLLWQISYCNKVQQANLLELYFLFFYYVVNAAMNK